MKIAIVTEYYYPDVGGTPEHVYQLARSLIDRGHDVRVIAPHFGAENPADPNHVPVQRIGNSALLMSNGSLSRATVGWRLGKKVQEYLHDEQFDVVHVHSPLFPTLPVLAIKHAPERTAVVATLHTHFAKSRVLTTFRGLCQKYMDACDRVIAVSESAARSASEYASFDYQVIPTDVFCFPTNIVASPVTLLEAMAAGCACIACDVEGVGTVLRHERDGLLVPVDDDAALAHALELLLTNPLLREKYRAAARRKADEQSWSRLAPQIE